MKKHKQTQLNAPLLRQHSVQSYWAYLPTFRVVAEVGSVTTAARLMFVTPSAVSKSLHRLEEVFGQPVFKRAGGKLLLTIPGRGLLDATREALRMVEDAWSEANSIPVCLRIAADERAMFVLGRALGRTEPAVSFSLSPLSTDDCAHTSLLRGEVDLLLTEKAEPTAARLSRGLTELHLGKLSVVRDGPRDLPVAAGIGLATVGKSAPLPTVLAQQLGLEPSEPSFCFISATLRTPSSQGVAVGHEILRVLDALKAELIATN